MLDGQSGVVQGTVDTSPAVSKHFRERWFFAQVTPFSVHAKIGHFNTLVWVTDYQTGRPVAGAAVEIYRDTYSALPQQPAILTHGTTNAEGVAMLAGTRQIDPDLKFIHSYNMNDPRLFVKVEKNDDLALLPLDHYFQVDTYRASRYSVSPRLQQPYGHIHTWGTTAQGVYKAGDTIQYKLYVRDQDNETFVPAPQAGYTLEVIDPTGKTVHTVADLTLSEFGAYDGEFSVPENGAVGWYRFQLKAGFSEAGWEPMRVLVSDFTPAPFKVTTDLNAGHFQPGDQVAVTTQARLHAGGPYADAACRVTATLESRAFSSEDPAARGFVFSTFVPDAPSRQTVYQTEDAVDDQGNLTTRFTLGDSKILYGRLVVESAVRDDRGKYIAGRAAADYAGRDRYVGLRREGWVMNEDESAGRRGAGGGRSGQRPRPVCPCRSRSSAAKPARPGSKAPAMPTSPTTPTGGSKWPNLRIEVGPGTGAMHLYAPGARFPSDYRHRAGYPQPAAQHGNPSVGGRQRTGFCGRNVRTTVWRSLRKNRLTAWGTRRAIWLKIPFPAPRRW